MTVRRIVANVAADQLDAAKGVLRRRTWDEHRHGPRDARARSLHRVSTICWRSTRGCSRPGLEIEYGPITEPWGVRRFYVRDPFGRLINILEHG